MACTTPTGVLTEHGSRGWRHVGADERDRELEIIAVEIENDEAEAYLLVIHVMPTQLRGSGSHA